LAPAAAERLANGAQLSLFAVIRQGARVVAIGAVDPDKLTWIPERAG
jgi:hypothetical protein